jgi:hypothetical protein
MLRSDDIYMSDSILSSRILHVYLITKEGGFPWSAPDPTFEVGSQSPLTTRRMELSNCNYVQRTPWGFCVPGGVGCPGYCYIGARVTSAPFPSVHKRLHTETHQILPDIPNIMVQIGSAHIQEQLTWANAVLAVLIPILFYTLALMISLHHLRSAQQQRIESCANPPLALGI